VIGFKGSQKACSGFGCLTDHFEEEWTEESTCGLWKDCQRNGKLKLGVARDQVNRFYSFFGREDSKATGKKG
jgi:hypothetical protein